MAATKPDAVTQAVKLLSGREKSEARLRAALESRGYSGEEIDAAIRRMVGLGYLNDARVALSRARAALQEGRARADVVRRLQRDGFAASLVEGVVTELLTETGYDEGALARRLLAKKKLTGAKAARWLAGRGFEEEVIRQLVPSIAGGGEDD